MEDAKAVGAMRLARIEKVRAAAVLARDGHDAREIARRLDATEVQVARMLRLTDLRDGADEETPEEVILRAALLRTDRLAMVETLKSWPYSFGETAPYPAEGKVRGTWDDVRQAHFEGWLGDDEFEEIRQAVDPRVR